MTNEEKIKDKLAQRGIHIKSDVSYMDIHDNDSVSIHMSSKQEPVTVSEDFETFEKMYMQGNEGEIVSIYDRHAGLVDGVKWQNDRVRVRAYAWLKNQPQIGVADSFIKELCDYITQ